MRVVGNVEHDQLDKPAGIEKCAKSQREPPVLPGHARPENRLTYFSDYGEKEYESCPQPRGRIVEQIKPSSKTRKRKKQRQQDERKDDSETTPEHLLPRWNARKA